MSKMAADDSNPSRLYNAYYLRSSLLPGAGGQAWDQSGDKNWDQKELFSICLLPLIRQEHICSFLKKKKMLLLTRTIIVNIYQTPALCLGPQPLCEVGIGAPFSR